MRKISKEEAKQYTIQHGGSSPVRTAVMALEPGEFLLIEKKDWKPKNTPGQMLSRVTQRTGMEFKLKKIASGEGWLVERLK
jgi:hypothetical protein